MFTLRTVQRWPVSLSLNTVSLSLYRRMEKMNPNNEVWAQIDKQWAETHYKSSAEPGVASWLILLFRGFEVVLLLFTFSNDPLL